MGLSTILLLYITNLHYNIRNTDCILQGMFIFLDFKGCIVSQPQGFIIVLIDLLFEAAQYR